MKATVAAVIMSAVLTGPVLAADQPYAGQETREIASLSEADVAALMAGEGWGLALPAELNGYPGPAHILELAAELELTEDQRAEIQAVFEAMRAEARRLGSDYVEAERHLSRMFRAGHAEPGMLQAQLAASSEALAELRLVHLAAHLDVTPLLTEAQRAAYTELRGYGGAHDGDHGDHGGH